ncbi:MAG: ABC transporter substrate-binding protein [Deltaproteobacteria bacterium]|nr:ABC transporter substrate-binding protein [Deltaproteobacteria bacterium]
MLKRRVLLALAIVSAAVLSIAVFSGGQIQAQSGVKDLKYGSTFVYSSLDPADNFSGWFSVELGLLETLAKLDDRMRPIPHLAESIENVEPTTWKVTLKDGVKFHNGQPLTAQAAKDSLERVIGLNERAKTGLLIESIAVDGRVLTIKTTTPHPTFINALCDPFASIVFTGELTPTVVYGTGPFKVDNFIPNGNAYLVRFDDYWGGKPKLDKYTYVYQADPGTLTMALQSGEIDASCDIPGPSRQLFRDKPDYNILSTASSRVLFLYYNLKNAIIGDVAVRKAINMALDKATYCDVLLDGACRVATSLFPDYLPYSGDRVKGTAFDLEGAKAALEAAGYKAGADGIRAKDGKPLSITISTYTSRVELPILAEAIQAQLREIGIDVKLDVMESVEEKLQAGDFEIIIYSLVTTPLGDPQSMLDNLLKSTGAYNYGKFADPETDKQIAELTGEFDQAKRIELAVNIQKKAMEENAFGFIGHQNRTLISRKGVVDLPNHPSDIDGVNAKTDLVR